MSNFDFLREYVAKLPQTREEYVDSMHQTFNYLRVKLDTLEKENKQLREEIYKLEKIKEDINMDIKETLIGKVPETLEEQIESYKITLNHLHRNSIDNERKLKAFKRVFNKIEYEMGLLSEDLVTNKYYEYEFDYGSIFLRDKFLEKISKLLESIDDINKGGY